MNKLLIVDGHNLLFQMFFGMPSRILNKSGKAIHGTLGFVGALLKIIRMTKPTHVVVMFDSEHNNQRKELNENYKANRVDYSKVDNANNPFSQLPDVYSALAYLNIKRAEASVFETDDVIAAYALEYGNDNKIVISSLDSDFFQLINSNVSVLRYRGDQTVICNEQYVKDKFGISALQFADFKSMTGDKADNIKGADKIGAKTAAQLLNEFGSLDNIILQAEAIKKPSVRNSIISNSEQLKSNQRLIVLDNRASIPFALNDLEYTYNGITTNEVLFAIGLK